MRTTLDIPDPIYREVKIRAASEGTTIREVVLEGLAMKLQNGSIAAMQKARPRFPAVQSRHPGSLKLGKEGVYDYIPFP
ncbi:MAG: hypothetical protein ACRD3N_01305 [Terracidiphilus sp.]